MKWRPAFVTFLAIVVIAASALLLDRYAFSRRAPSTTLPPVAVAKMAPQLVVRAGATDDVYVLLESTASPKVNAIERSTNGGQSFVKMGTIPIASAPTSGTLLVDQLLFPNLQDGYAIGPLITTSKGTRSTLYATFDAGREWRAEEISPNTEIRQIAASATYLYALTQRCPDSTAPCSDLRLDRTPVSTRHWVELPVPAPLSKYGSVMNLTAFGNGVWLSTQDQLSAPWNSYVATSRNDGASFSVAVQPLLESVTACGLAAMSQETLWAICDDGMQAGQIPFSQDGGAHWTVDSSLSQLSSFHFGAFDPVTSELAFFVNGLTPSTLYTVTSGTATPVVEGTVPRAGNLTDLCFVNRDQGVGLFSGNGAVPTSALWSTSDGGAHWKKVLT